MLTLVVRQQVCFKSYSFQLSKIAFFIDLYSPSSGPIDYFSANRSPDVSGMNATTSLFGKSTDLQQRQMVMSGNRGTGSASAVATGSNDLILTDACLKNLNQLAKLNSGKAILSMISLLINSFTL